MWVHDISIKANPPPKFESRYFMSKEILGHECSWQHYSQELKGAKHPRAHPWWVNETCFRGRVEYDSASKRNEARIYAMEWTTLKNITLVKKSHTREPYVVWSHFYEITRIGESVETESPFAALGARGRGNGSDCLMEAGSPFGVMKMFCKYREVMAVQHCEFTK